MILLVDIGNSRIKWATLTDGAFRPGGASVHRGRALPELLDKVLHGFHPRQVVCANVAGAETGKRFSEWVAHAWGVTPRFAEAEAMASGVRNGYERPERLGVDRWLALVGTRQLHPGAACIIDCGSAITVDLLNAAGQHLGGSIAPGLALMQKVLVTDTAGIGLNMSIGGEPLLGRTTDQCVASGTHYAAAAFVDRMVAEAGNVLGEAMVSIITGGDAPVLLPLLSCECRFEPDLVLLGLACIAGDHA